MSADPPAAAARSLFFDAPRMASIRTLALPPLAPGCCLVRTIVSAISAGTEMLFYRGDLPAGLSADASIASLRQPAAYPIRYGYAAVGCVEQVGPGVDVAWLGRTVFAFEPHATCFVAPVDALQPVPAGIDPASAALLPTMETAVTLVLDGAPLLGERVVIYGAGMVGLFVTALLARFPLAELTVVDAIDARRRHAVALGAHKALSPSDAGLPRDADLVYELSGNPAALDAAIQSAGFEARVVIGSWYGRKRAPVDLGGHFHRSRMRLLSSQVSTLGAAWAPRWSRGRRFETAWSMLAALEIAPLISHRFAFERAADAFALLDLHPADALQVLLFYGQDA